MRSAGIAERPCLHAKQHFSSYSATHSIAIWIAMLVSILRPIPINYYNNAIVSITIISDQLHSI
jgi:hypothetical protein